VSDGSSDTLRHAASFEIVNRLGLHARAAALVAETASRFLADVTLTKSAQTVDAKSVLDLMLLAAGRGTVVQVVAAGPDAVAAVAAIGQLIACRFHEEE
jgi:phosphocarrier protein HPr